MVLLLGAKQVMIQGRTNMPEVDRPQLCVAQFPGNAACAVTSSWDDNDNANMEILELLDSMGLKGTFYVDPGNPRARWAMGDGLTQSQLRRIARDNEVGSHTWSHKNLQQCDASVVREELSGSKDHIEKITRQAVLGVAYPWGEHSRTTERVARECGYLFARTVEEGNTRFPPSNCYAWGVSVHALPRPRLLSRKAHIYVRNLASDWRTLALKLFERARQTNGVWHIYGHAWEVLQQPGLKDDLTEICRRVARKNDVWYATNGMLFINEAIKSRVSITSSCCPTRFVFRVQAKLPSEALAGKIRVPLRLVVPKSWAGRFDLKVIAAGSGRFEMGRTADHVWIDVFDDEAKVELTRE